MTGLTQPFLRDTVAVVCDSHAARSGAVALILDGYGQMRGPFSQIDVTTVMKLIGQTTGIGGTHDRHVA